MKNVRVFLVIVSVFVVILGLLFLGITRTILYPDLHLADGDLVVALVLGIIASHLIYTVLTEKGPPFCRFEPASNSSNYSVKQRKYAKNHNINCYG